MGAVLHTLNIRLFPEQLAYVINHAQDKLIILDDSLVPMLAKVAAELTSVERYIVIGDGDTSALESVVPNAEILRYYALLAAEPCRSTSWPDVDERQAAALCYTSGTTGDPKGVAYSHRSAYLHSLAAMTPAGLNLSERERILAIVPMFHANAWGIPYAAFMCGASLIMPGAVPPGRAKSSRAWSRRSSASRSPARCPPSGPTSFATARSTRSTSRRSA